MPHLATDECSQSPESVFHIPDSVFPFARNRCSRSSGIRTKPRWLLAVPDVIRQLETLDRDLLTRRDVERLFGVSRARAAQLMRTFGAARVGASRVLRRTALLRQLRKYRQRAAFRGEEERRTRLVAELRQARLTGIRVAVPREARAARLSGLPDGVSVEPWRIEVRFRGAQDAVGRLFALAQALTHDYERFEELVEGGDLAGGGGEVRE